MNIQLRIDCTNATHTHFTVFLDEVYCGQLCVTNEEFNRFAYILTRGINLVTDPPDAFERVGNTWDEVKQARAALMREQR